MSYYLIKQLEEIDNVAVRTRTEVVEALLGDEHLQRLVLRNNETGQQEIVDSSRCSSSSAPHRARSGSTVSSSATAVASSIHPDLMTEGKPPAGWPLDREPYYLESSVPGVFVAGDVRADSVKRVASAVGEGAMAVTLVHRYLEEQ